MTRYTEEEILKMENTVKSIIPFSNAYFMNIYTNCKELLAKHEASRGDALATICKGVDFLGQGDSFKIEMFALMALLGTSRYWKIDELKPFETARNTVINAIKTKKEFCNEGLGPCNYTAYLVKLHNEGMKEAFITEMCILSSGASYMLEHPINADLENLNDPDVDAKVSIVYAHALELAYIDTMLDMNNLRLEGHAQEARERFSILATKLRKEFSI